LKAGDELTGNKPESQKSETGNDVQYEVGSHWVIPIRLRREHRTRLAEPTVASLAQVDRQGTPARQMDYRSGMQ
jgi:hypothetical protein